MYDPSKILTWLEGKVQMRRSRMKTLADITSAAMRMNAEAGGDDFNESKVGRDARFALDRKAQRGKAEDRKAQEDGDERDA